MHGLVHTRGGSNMPSELKSHKPGCGCGWHSEPQEHWAVVPHGLLTSWCASCPRPGGDGGSRPRSHDLANVRRFCTRLGVRWRVGGGCWGKGAIVLISWSLAQPNQESLQNMKGKPRNEGGRWPKVARQRHREPRRRTRRRGWTNFRRHSTCSK